MESDKDCKATMPGDDCTAVAAADDDDDDDAMRYGIIRTMG